MIDRIEAGRRVKAARLAAGITQEDAAARMGWGRAQLSAIETGRRVPAWPALVEVVARLGLDPRRVVPEWFEGREHPDA